MYHNPVMFSQKCYDGKRLFCSGSVEHLRFDIIRMRRLDILVLWTKAFLVRLITELVETSDDIVECSFVSLIQVQAWKGSCLWKTILDSCLTERGDVILGDQCHVSVALILDGRKTGRLSNLVYEFAQYDAIS